MLKLVVLNTVINVYKITLLRLSILFVMNFYLSLT